MSKVRILKGVFNCRECKVPLTIDNCYRHSKRLSGFQEHCKKCQSVYNKLPGRRKYHKNYYETNKDKLLKQQLIRVLKRDYGLTQEQVEIMRKQQKGLCAICSTRECKSIDHDHKTGKVRGLLCNQCNMGLGLLMESVKVLENAISYLHKFSTSKGNNERQGL